MTIVTGTIKDVTGQPDNSAWVFYSVLRQGADSDVVTSKWVREVPVDGALSADLEPGFCIVNAPNGQVYNITVPDSGTPDIWALLAAAVAFPPGTSAADVAAAVDAYFASGGSVTSVQAALARTSLRRPLRNTCIALGVSMSAADDVPGLPYRINDNFLNQICLETFQRVQFAGVYAHPSWTQAQVISTILPVVLALNPAPGACFYWDAPINDIGASVSFAQTKANLKTVVAALLGNSIVPILGTLGPVYLTDDSKLAAVQQWNTWIRRYAAQNGFPLMDAATALTGADGHFLSAGLQLGDNEHPSPAGHRAIAHQAIADGIAEVFPPNGTVRTSRWTGDLSNLFNNGTLNLGLFTTNSGGIGTGLSSNGTTTTTCSIVAPAPSDELIGNWQQLSLTTGSTGDISLYTFLTGYSVGDVLALSGRVQTSGITATGSNWIAGLGIDVPGGYAYPPPGSGSATNLLAGCSFYADVDDGLFYTEVTVPPGTADIYLQLFLNATTNPGTCALRVGELTVVNLTTGGLLT
jgi:hypothetical protein